MLFYFFKRMCSRDSWGRLCFCRCSWMRFTIPSLNQGLLSSQPSASEENGRHEEHRNIHIQKHLEWVSSGEQGPQPFPRSQIGGWVGGGQALGATPSAQACTLTFLSSLGPLEKFGVYHEADRPQASGLDAPPPQFHLPCLSYHSFSSRCLFYN